VRLAAVPEHQASLVGAGCLALLAACASAEESATQRSAAHTLLLLACDPSHRARVLAECAGLRDAAVYSRWLTAALPVSAATASDFIHKECSVAAAARSDLSTMPLDSFISITLQALLAHAAAGGRQRDEVLPPIAAILEASMAHYSTVFEPALAAWSGSASSAGVLEHFVATHDAQLVGASTPASPRCLEGATLRQLAFDEQPSAPRQSIVLTKWDCILLSLACLFLARPATLTAFRALVPRAVASRLRVGSAARHILNALLLERGEIDARLEKMITATDDFVRAPFFWNAEVLSLCNRRCMAEEYASLSSAVLATHDGREVHLYTELLVLLLRLSSLKEGDAPRIAKRTKQVLDQFERNREEQVFLLGILDTIDKRSLEQPEHFTDTELTVLGEVAQNGVVTLSSVSDVGGRSADLCRRAMMTLLHGYVRTAHPSQWKALFKEANNAGFMLKYMFRESLDATKQMFLDVASDKRLYSKGAKAAEALELVQKLAHAAIEAYGAAGVCDQETLARLDFISEPQLLLEVVGESERRAAAAGNVEMQLFTQLTAKWMQLMIDRQLPPLTPHHTQALTVLMMARFLRDYLQPAAEAKAKPKHKCFVAQVGTGEGKSIVIAMLAIFVVKLFGKKVHILENNEGLLLRDYNANKLFYEQFDIQSGIKLDSPELQICYCLKSEINRHFLRKMIEGTLDEEARATVLIVDEVDDLIVNERPTDYYAQSDADLTPQLRKCYKSIKAGDYSLPQGVSEIVWEEAMASVTYCREQTEREKHWRIITDSNGNQRAIMLDAQGRVPKVTLTSPWLTWLNYNECGILPKAETRYAVVCTPYMFNKYACIFGLTGSVGGRTELDYLTKTYNAVKFNVPRFLDTCSGDARKEVKNKGVEVVEDHAALIARVVQVAKEHYRKCPVLIITADRDQLSQLHNALRHDEEIPPDNVQRLSEFDENGKSLKAEWESIVEDAGKRLGHAGDTSCRVTVTDHFGGRGHDFQVVDQESNDNGGMLVITTSIPNEREWIQWKGRTARQDRPGQFFVLLNKQAPPFSLPKHKKLLGKLNGLTPDEKIEALLEVSDEGIGERLKEFEFEQATGEKLNELTERFYKAYPRSHSDSWPSAQHHANDVALRSFLEKYTVAKLPSVSDVRKFAKLELGIVLS